MSARAVRKAPPPSSKPATAPLPPFSLRRRPLRTASGWNTEGHRLLRIAMRRLSVKPIALACCVTPAAIYALAQGKQCCPAGPTMAVLHRVFLIDCGSWFEPPKRFKSS
jgi:hypothetical protein